MTESKLAQGLDERGVPLDANARAGRLAGMEAWLGSLVGRFRIDGTYRNHGGTSPVRGSATCQAIGSGPGVTCEFTATWKAGRESRKDLEFDSALYRAMQSLVVMIGIDPEASQIRMTLLDSRALRMQGFLIGDAVAFRGESLFDHDVSNPPVQFMWTSSLLSARAGGDASLKLALLPTVGMYWAAGVAAAFPNGTGKAGIEFDLQLHRESPFVAGSQPQQSDSAPDDPTPMENSGNEGNLVQDVAESDWADIADSIESTRETDAGEAPSVQQQVSQQSAVAILEEVSIAGVPERRRPGQYRRPPPDPDVITVRRNGTTRVRIQPFTSREEIRFRRESGARVAVDGTRSSMQLLRDVITLGDGQKIRDITLNVAANVDEADGLPALIPFGRRASVLNIDYIRLIGSERPTLTKVTNAINPQTRQCEATLGIADNGADDGYRFVLLGDRPRDCEGVVRDRQGDLFFAEGVPQRVRESVSEIYGPVYNRFAGLLGSEPGTLFVVWRPESTRNDFRFERGWSRSGLLVLNGSVWQQEVPSQLRGALEDKLAAEQLLRRFGQQSALGDFALSAMSYLLMLDRLHDKQVTARQLKAELPAWIEGCVIDLGTRASHMTAVGGVPSYNCGLVLQFVYDAVARAGSRGKDSIHSIWRTLLTESYGHGDSGVSPGAFVASSEQARRVARGLLGGSMDWAGFVQDLEALGVELAMTNEGSTRVEVVSLRHFLDHVQQQ